MPKKKNSETQERQCERFDAEVERLIVAGELNPTEVAAAIEKLLGNVKPHKAI